MIRIITALAFTILAASPALARPLSAPHAPRGNAPAHDPYMGYSAADPSVVAIDGAYVGRDPDPNIRAQLRRFPGSYVSGGF